VLATYFCKELFSASTTELPVLTHRFFPCDRNHGIHAHVHRQQIDDFVDATLPNCTIPQIGSAQVLGYFGVVVDSTVVWFLRSVDKKFTEQCHLLLS